MGVEARSAAYTYRPMSVSLERVRAISDGLFSTLTQEAWLTRPVAERHRLLFYLGHLEAFDWNTLVQAPSLNAPFEKLFALGIDPIDDLPADRPEDWPRLEVVSMTRATRRPPNRA